MLDPDYVELHCHSAFSFLDGASQPDELADRAAVLGYRALALTDHDNLCGALVFAHAARAVGVQPLTGCELTVEDGGERGHLTLLVEDREGYGNLCELLTLAHAGTRAPEGGPVVAEPAAPLESVLERAQGLVCLSGCATHGLLAAPLVRGERARAEARAGRLAEAFGERLWVELTRPFQRGDRARVRALVELARRRGLPLVATNDVHVHVRRRGPLQDALVAIRTHATLDACEPQRRGNREHVLKPPAEMAALFADLPEAVRATRQIAERCRFDLTRDLGYRPPQSAADPDRELAELTRARFAERYPPGSPHRSEAAARLQEELKLISHHELAGFFLLHFEVLELAREVALEVRGKDAARHVLPPGRGRGSSVGSIVCYLTGLSHVDPVEGRLSLGRFLNRELASVPDIDLDFPRDIRERLIVQVHERYGPRQSALVGAFATYRARGAIRELGKVLGLPPSDIARLASASDGWSAANVGEELRRLPGIAERAGDLRFRALDALAREIAGLPRHLAQHPGGMVISDRPLDRLVPLQPAAMAGRTLCQWDKDSCADAGFLKIDLLGLGMLSAVESCVTELGRAHGEHLDLSRIPLDDPEVYAEIQAADTVGVFQIESRAQMQMLLRTQPENLDDLVIEVALVRPGPIQGGAVHPYLHRRQALRRDPGFPIPYDHPLLEEPLRETLGVIVFQDQVLDVAQALAGFTAGQAETLRRAMSRRRSRAAMETQWQAFRDGALARGVPEHTAQLVFDKILAFSAFGFPKAHSAAFALLAYQSAWLRRHRPAAFLCALLNAQPMGFYPPASLVRDAERRGIEVRHPDLHRSHVEARLEDGAVRVGLAAIAGLGEEGAAAVVREREAGGPFASVRDLARRLELPQDRLERLVASGACDALGSRRRLVWELGLAMRSAPARGGRQLALDLRVGDVPVLPEPDAWELLVADYAHVGLSVREHPIARIRREMDDVVSSRDLYELPTGRRIALPGLAIARQRPASANGVVFLLLEDEFGLVNLILMPDVYDRFRLLARTEPLLLAEGALERRERNVNIVVESLQPLDAPGRRTIGRARRGRRPAAATAALADLRAVAPPPQHFAQGRRAR
jgi:error-prone DNA polymerase